MYTILIIILIATLWYFLSEKEEDNSSTTATHNGRVSKSSTDTQPAKSLSKKAILYKSKYHLDLNMNVSIYLDEDYFLNPKSKKYESMSEFINICSEITKVFLIVQLTQNSSEEKQTKVSLIKENISYYQSCPHLILFFTTAIGKVSIIRQTNPALYIEQDINTVSAITFVLRKIIMLCDRQDGIYVSDYDTIESFNEII